MKVLVVDDDADVALMLRYALGARGFDIDIVSDSSALLDLAAWEGVDVAVIDLMMPNVSGEELLIWLIDNKPDIRRVVWSAAGGARLARLDGLAVILPKPSEPDAIARAINGG